MQHDVPTVTTDARDAESGEERIAGVVVGLFLGLNDAGQPLVDYPGNPGASARPARSVAMLRPEDRGREAALLFEEGDPCRPILVGLMQGPMPGRAVSRDEDRLVLRAEREIVLECGEASITLTRAGKVLIRGNYVLSRSSGVNMVKGGVIHLN